MVQKKVNYANKAVKGTLTILFISFLAALLGYLVRLVLARGLSKDDYGLFYAVFSFFAFLIIFKDLGLNQTLTKFVSDFLHKKDYSGMKSVIASVFAIQFTISTLIAIIAIIFSDQLALHFFHIPSASIVIKFLAVMFMLMPLENVFTYSFQAFQKMNYYAGIGLFRMLFLFGLIALFIKMGFGIIAPSLSYIFVYLIVPMICVPFFLRLFPGFFKVKLNITPELVKALIKFGLPVITSMFGFMIMGYTDTLMLTYFKGVKDVALYQVASPTASLSLYLSYALAAVFLPLSAELWIKGHKEKLKQAMELLYKYTFIVVIPIAFILLMFPKLIIKILFGAAYTDASIAMQILAVGAIFYTIGNINGTVLAGIGKPGENTRIILFAALFNLIINSIFIPRYGILGAAGTTCASWFIVFAFTSFKVYRHIGAVSPVWGWVKNFIAGAAFIFVIYFLKAWLELNVWLEMAVSIGVAALVYTALILLFRIITKEDLGFAKYALGVKNQILDYFIS